MTLRSNPDPGCPYCKGSGVVSVSKDPDQVDECTCMHAERVTVSIAVPDGTVAVVLFRWTDAGELEARLAESRTVAPAPRDTIVDALVRLSIELNEQRKALDIESEVGHV
ncbi:hypothetical protein ACTJI8_12905 [Microbacterium sp. 22303]|uniref:hypothetical protein n=1 Tax=Microbacterium sp. 22303 TaxID=3453905 RepID=UPI003F87AB85